jgi:hypothetical protein
MEKELEELKRRFAESQWFLGEEKAKAQQLEDMLKGCQQRDQQLEREVHALRGELYRIQKELQDAQWFLGEEKARRHELEEELRKKIG